MEEEEPTKFDSKPLGPTEEEIAMNRELALKLLEKKQVFRAIRALTKRYKKEKSQSTDKEELFKEEEEEIDNNKEIDKHKEGNQKTFI